MAETHNQSLGRRRVHVQRQLRLLEEDRTEGAYRTYVNLNFDVTGPAATYSGAAVVDYVLQFGPNLRTFAAICQGEMFPPGEDPLDPEIDPGAPSSIGAYRGFLYQRARCRRA